MGRGGSTIRAWELQHPQSPAGRALSPASPLVSDPQHRLFPGSSGMPAVWECGLGKPLQHPCGMSRPQPTPPRLPPSRCPARSISHACISRQSRGGKKKKKPQKLQKECFQLKLPLPPPPPAPSPKGGIFPWKISPGLPSLPCRARGAAAGGGQRCPRVPPGRYLRSAAAAGGRGAPTLGSRGRARRPFMAEQRRPRRTDWAARRDGRDTAGGTGPPPRLPPPPPPPSPPAPARPPPAKGHSGVCGKVRGERAERGEVVWVRGVFNSAPGWKNNPSSPGGRERIQGFGQRLH